MDGIFSFASSMVEGITTYENAQSAETYGIIELVIGLLQGIYEMFSNFSA